MEKDTLKYMTGIFVCLLILILTGSVFLSHKADKVAREIADKEILTAHDVIQTLKIKGITFEPETSRDPQDYKIEDTEPTIYQDSHGNFLFIYRFASFVERPNYFSEFPLKEKFSFTIEEKTYITKLYRVKNLLLFYSYPYQETNQQAVSNYLAKIDQVIFTHLNAGKEIVFTGESPSWKAKVTVKYYEHRWTDSENKVHYESYHTKAPTIHYKGQIPEQPLYMECSFTCRASKMGSTREITPEELTRDITLGYGGGNGLHPREDDTYEVKITWDGKTEEFEAKNRDTTRLSK